jgi:uridylate kinase
MKKLFVISLGGSLVVPDEVSVKFLAGFKRLVENETRKGSRFIIITGGGAVARHYGSALLKLGKPSEKDVDWLGIQATWLNAKLVQLMFGKLAHPKIISDPNSRVDFKEKILVAGGWMPGRSTDDDAVRLAIIYGSKTIINLSNIEFLYNKDPKKYPNAKKLTEVSWGQLLKITGRKWKPGANFPFDPTAAKNARKHKLKAIIADGKNLSNLKKILSQKPFKGTFVK